MRIAFEQVGFRYDTAEKGAWTLRDVSFSVGSGDFLGIAGHTGSGKSTLIRHMNGLAHPTEGRVTVDGRDLANPKAASEARSRVGVVFQYPENQLFAGTVYDDVAFGPRNAGLDAPHVDERVRDALGSVGLDFDEVHARNPFALSGGQRRRVALAGVLACAPEVLVLDEPTSGLDPKARRAMLDLVDQLHERGLGIVMVSHSMDDLAQRAERILILNDGEVFALGSPSEVLACARELTRIGLDAPAAQLLANDLREAGFDLPLPYYSEGALADALSKALRKE